MFCGLPPFKKIRGKFLLENKISALNNQFVAQAQFEDFQVAFLQ
jgi:hypothetical protein